MQIVQHRYVHVWESKKSVAYEFFLVSPTMPWISCSSYLDALLWDGWWVADQLLFCGVLLPGFFQNSTFLRSSNLAFSPSVSLASMMCILAVVLTQPYLLKKYRFILSNVEKKSGNSVLSIGLDVDYENMDTKVGWKVHRLTKML